MGTFQSDAVASEGTDDAATGPMPDAALRGASASVCVAGHRFRPARVLGLVAVAAASVAAGWVVIGTVVVTVRHHYPLPWFDEWVTIDLFRRWRHGGISLPAALVSRHNEHRILFPRLVFFADLLWLAGRGWLSIWASLAVQAIQGGLFAWVLARARPVTPGTWIVGAAVLALMFDLGQVENFGSGFQLQFFGVFAAATSSMLAFGAVVDRSNAGRPFGAALAGSLALAAVATFTMANGILAALLLPPLGVAARLRRGVVALTAAWAVLLAALYVQGQSLGGQGGVLDRLRPFGLLLDYETTYLGNVLQIDRIATPAALGGLALTLVGLAAARALRGPLKPASVAMVGAMLFVVLSGVVTASGRMEYGVRQALSSRYVTGAVMLWAALLVAWWIDPPGGRLRRPARIAALAMAALLLVGAFRAQRTARRLLDEQYAAQVKAGEVLAQGRDDPAAIAAGAGPVAEVERLTPFLRQLKISIFAGRPMHRSSSGSSKRFFHESDSRSRQLKICNT